MQVLDHELSPLPSEFNPADWVEYVISGRQRWADGTRINSDDVIHTRVDLVEINFRSDAANELRGFWIAYSGKYRDFEAVERKSLINYIVSQPKACRACAYLVTRHFSHLQASVDFHVVIDVRLPAYKRKRHIQSA